MLITSAPDDRLSENIVSNPRLLVHLNAERYVGGSGSTHRKTGVSRIQEVFPPPSHLPRGVVPLQGVSEGRVDGSPRWPLPDARYTVLAATILTDGQVRQFRRFTRHRAAD